MKLCEYGCGQEAKFQLKNRKWCCSKNYYLCVKGRKLKPLSIEVIEKIKKIKHNNPEIITNHLCDYGCGKIAKYKFKNGKFCCSKFIQNCLSIKNSVSKKVKINWSNNEIREKQINQMKGHKYRSKTTEEKIFLKNSMKKIWSNPNSIFNSKEFRKKRRQNMLNGGAIKALKGIKKISKPEIKLRDMVKELYPDCEFQYGIFNYSVDIAIPDYKIAIEFDGYFHFDTEEHKEYHEKRQLKIENEGWKFYRVTMFDKFPTLEEVKKNLLKIIEG